MYIIIISFVELVIRHGHFGWPSWPSSKREASGGTHHVMCTGSWLPDVSGGAHHVMCTGSWLPGVLSGDAHHVMCTGSWLHGVLSMYLWCVQEVAARCVVKWCTPSGVYRKLIAWCVVRWCTPCDVYRKLIAWCVRWCTPCNVYRKLVVWCVVRWCTPCDVYRKLIAWCVVSVLVMSTGSCCQVCCQVVHTKWCVREVDCMVCCQCACDLYRKLIALCVVRWCTTCDVYRKLIAWCVVMWCTTCDVYRKLIAWCVVRWCTPCNVYRKWGHHTQPWNPALWLYPCVSSDQHSYIGKADFYTLCFIPRDCEELGLGGWYIAWDMYCHFGGIYSVCYQFETFLYFFLAIF